MNRPSQNLNEVMFPRYPVGPGNTPGGDGGVWLQGMPGFQSYWGFGRRRRTSKKRSKRISRKRSSKVEIFRMHLIDAIKSRDKERLAAALDNFDQTLGWDGDKHPLYIKGLKILNSLGGKATKRSRKSRRSRRSRRRSRRSRSRKSKKSKKI
jgi:hypothetical protein